MSESEDGPDRPVLIGCAHGTRLPAGRRTMALLRLDVARARPGVEVRAAHVDVHKPALDDVVRRFAARRRPLVVVPLLLSTGFHVRVDIARAIDAATEAGGPAVAAAALGPDPVLVRLLQQRLAEAGAGPEDPVVLAAAGSSDPRATADVERIVTDLSAARGGAPVRAGYLATARPTVAEAVTRIRQEHPGPVAVASYLLAPGHFSARLETAGADRVSAPLAPHPDLAALALARFDAALAHLPPAPTGERAGRS
jgi:sirohydrochlorin ferrochelatase